MPWRHGGKDDSRLWLAALLILTAIVLSPSVANRFIIDDRWLIVDNRYLGDWSFFWKSLVNGALWFQDPLHPPQRPYYRPLQNFWFAINFHLFGLHPKPWHAAMIALHLLAVWLVFRVAARLANDTRTALLTAALFALMPLHAAAIGWTSAIGTLLSSAFAIEAFEFYLIHREASRPRDLALSLTLFVAALLSYDSAVAFPGLIAAHALIMGDGNAASASDRVASIRRGTRRAIAACFPYAMVIAAYLPLRIWALGGLGRPAPENPAALSLYEVLLTAPSALLDFGALLAMPWRAGVAHRLAIVWNATSPGFLLPALTLAAFCAGLVMLLRNHPHRRLYLFCATWVVIPLLPVLDLKAVVAQAAIQDRYLYLPSFGFCLFLSDLTVGWLSAAGTIAHLAQIGIATLVVVYGAAIVRVQQYWRDEVAWYSRCIVDVPMLEICHRKLGAALADAADYAGARREFQAAIAIDPTSGVNHFNLGVTYDQLGDPRAAAHEMITGLGLLTEPTAEAYARLAMVSDSAGDATEREDALKHAESLQGGTTIAAIARAQIRLRHGDRAGADAIAQDLIRRDPANIAAKDLVEKIDRMRSTSKP